MQLVNKTAAIYGMMLRLSLAGDKFFTNGGSVDLVVFAISISLESESMLASDLIYQSLGALLLSVSDLDCRDSGGSLLLGISSSGGSFTKLRVPSMTR